MWCMNDPKSDFRGFVENYSLENFINVFCAHHFSEHMDTEEMYFRIFIFWQPCFIFKIIIC